MDSVSGDTLIADLLVQRPEAARVLLEEFQLPCYRCELRFSETIAEGVSLSGLNPGQVVARLQGIPSSE